jgi:hypothetical protein
MWLFVGKGYGSYDFGGRYGNAIQLKVLVIFNLERR